MTAFLLPIRNLAFFLADLDWKCLFTYSWVSPTVVSISGLSHRFCFRKTAAGHRHFNLPENRCPAIGMHSVVCYCSVHRCNLHGYPHVAKVFKFEPFCVCLYRKWERCKKNHPGSPLTNPELLWAIKRLTWLSGFLCKLLSVARNRSYKNKKCIYLPDCLKAPTSRHNCVRQFLSVAVDQELRRPLPLKASFHA